MYCVPSGTLSKCGLISLTLAIALHFNHKQVIDIYVICSVCVCVCVHARVFLCVSTVEPVNQDT